MTATEQATSAEGAADSSPGERVSIPANAFYVPSPVVLLSTVNEDGEVDVSAMSAVGVVCLDPPVIAVGIKARRRTYRNIRRTNTFVVNLPLEEDLHAVDYTGTRKFRDSPDKVAESGLSIDRLPGTGLPYVTSCPVAMACEMVGNLGRNELGLDGPPSHQVVLGKITECTVERQWLADDELRLEDMPVLLYLNRVYAARGRNLGTQRFTDDPEVMAAKLREYRSLTIERKGPGWTSRPSTT